MSLSLLGLENVSIAFGGHPIINGAEFQIEKNDKVAVVGVNGSGKSTLLKLILGKLSPDSGRIFKDSGIIISELPQEIPTFGKSVTALDVILTQDIDFKSDKINTANRYLSQLNIPNNSIYNNLSAGNKRKVLFAKALSENPDILLLDEPTNHLDLPSIIQMERILTKWNKALLFVSHDRTFLQKIANTIIDIDRGSVMVWKNGYSDYLRRKEEFLHAESKEWERFDKKLSEEEKWIRKGIQARRTRNEGRVRTLKKMREERKSRRERTGELKVAIQTAEKSGVSVITAKNVDFFYSEEKPIIKNFSIRIKRGDKIGILGPNGCGKSTLLKLLTGNVLPKNGSIKFGTKLSPIYLGQLRSELLENQTVRKNILPNGEFIEFQGGKKHIVGYLKEFLFSEDKINSPLRNLSGGERARVLLAKLFTKPSNLIIMDEPTNDLDIETLELLEELLFSFNETIILVSHDRTFLENIVTYSLTFTESHEIKEVTSFSIDEKSLHKSKSTFSLPKYKKKTKKSNTLNKISYKEKIELESIPGKIEKLEEKLSTTYQDLSNPKFYKEHQNEISLINENLKILEDELENLYKRWDELEKKNH